MDPDDPDTGGHRLTEWRWTPLAAAKGGERRWCFGSFAGCMQGAAPTAGLAGRGGDPPDRMGRMRAEHRALAMLRVLDGERGRWSDRDILAVQGPLIAQVRR